MKRLNCYIYTRVSTSMQVEGFSLDAQREKLRKYAEYQEMHIAGEYSDEGKSGKNIGGRPDFQRMIEDVEISYLEINFLVPEFHVCLAPGRIGYEHGQKNDPHQQDTTVDVIVGCPLEGKT